MAYEEKAAAYLTEKGYRILHKNFYSSFGEIDIVARDGSCLVFVEVKYRSGKAGGHPLEAVDKRKQRRIGKTAVFYCCRYGYGENTPCRFDVIGILGNEMLHIEDAFTYTG